MRRRSARFPPPTGLGCAANATSLLAPLSHGARYQLVATAINGAGLRATRASPAFTADLATQPLAADARLISRAGGPPLASIANTTLLYLSFDAAAAPNATAGGVALSPSQQHAELDALSREHDRLEHEAAPLLT